MSFNRKSGFRLCNTMNLVLLWDQLLDILAYPGCLQHCRYILNSPESVWRLCWRFEVECMVHRWVLAEKSWFRLCNCNESDTVMGQFLDILANPESAQHRKSILDTPKIVPRLPWMLKVDCIFHRCVLAEKVDFAFVTTMNLVLIWDNFWTFWPTLKARSTGKASRILQKLYRGSPECSKSIA